MKSSWVLLAALVFVAIPRAEELSGNATPDDSLDEIRAPQSVPASFAESVEAAPPPETYEPAVAVKPKSHWVALALITATTAIPAYAGLRMSNFPDHVVCCGEPDARDIAGYSLSTVALVLGPAAGQYYAGAHRAAKVGLVIRTVGLSLLALGLATTSIDLNGGGSGGVGPMVVGGGLILGSAAYSILTTPVAVNRANERARQSAAQTSFAPTLFLVGEGRMIPGLAFNASF